MKTKHGIIGWEPTPTLEGEDAKRFVEEMNSEPTDIAVRTYKKALKFCREHEMIQ